VSVDVGQPAPDFSLVNQHGETVTLGQYRGKNVVLVFYPYAFSGTCTGELSALRERLAIFDNDETVTLAVSCDAIHSLRAFANAEGYTFSLLSDFWPHGETARTYGVFVEAKGAAKRGTFIIDRDGIVRWSVIHEIGEARNADEYEQALKGLDAV
jgi:mycoredoxin-dependent peroxiredoxin